MDNPENVDDLLAERAELLRTRASMRESGSFEFILSYETNCDGASQMRTYSASSQDFITMNDFIKLFLDDISIRIEEIENLLKPYGITVTRDAPTT